MNTVLEQFVPTVAEKVRILGVFEEAGLLESVSKEASGEMGMVCILIGVGGTSGFVYVEAYQVRTSLVIQWLKIPRFHCRGHRFDPWSGKFHMLHGAVKKNFLMITIKIYIHFPVGKIYL